MSGSVVLHRTNVIVVILSAVVGVLLGLVRSRWPDAGNKVVTLHTNGDLHGVTANMPCGRLSGRGLGDWAAGALGWASCDGCTLYDATAGRIESCAVLGAGADLWLVPPGRWFVFPTGELGRAVTVPRVESPRGPDKPIIVETISASPRVFHLHNFLDEAESDALVATALADTDPVTSLQRSTTGAEHQVSFNRVRTSDNAFDASSPVARRLKRRAVALLGMEPYVEEMTDGLQVLRYNRSKAYISHIDYLDDNNSGHDYDSSAAGSNRFATILFYLSDVERGGETVFPQGLPVDDGEVDQLDAVELRPVEPHDVVLRRAEARNETLDFRPGSWEHKMIGQCQGRLAVRPKKAHAILFYSQHPDGTLDPASKHGGCPVIKGTKWAANLWIWNKIRLGYPGAPRKQGASQFDTTAGIGRDRLHRQAASAGGGGKSAVSARQPQAQFLNEDLPNVELHYADKKWADLEPNVPIAVNTFPGHEWVLMVDGKARRHWVITQEEKQMFTIGKATL